MASFRIFWSISEPFFINMLFYEYLNQWNLQFLCLYCKIGCSKLCVKVWQLYSARVKDLTFQNSDLRSCHSNLLSNIKTDSKDIVIEYNFLALKMVAGMNAEKACTIPYSLANGIVIWIEMTYPLSKSTSCPIIYFIAYQMELPI